MTIEQALGRNARKWQNERFGVPESSIPRTGEIYTAPAVKPEDMPGMPGGAVEIKPVTRVTPNY